MWWVLKQRHILPGEINCTEEVILDHWGLGDSSTLKRIQARLKHSLCQGGGANIQSIKSVPSGLSLQSSGWDSTLPLWGARFSPWLGNWGPMYVPCGMAKIIIIKKKNLKKKRESILEIGIQGNSTFHHVTASFTKEFPHHDKGTDFQSVGSKEQRKDLLLV